MLTNKRLHAPISMQSCQTPFFKTTDGNEGYAAAGLYVGVKDHKIGGELSKRRGQKSSGSADEDELWATHMRCRDRDSITHLS